MASSRIIRSIFLAPPPAIRTSVCPLQLVYSLNTGRDYGTILCWARNELGAQAEPCVFHLIPAGEERT